MFVLILGVNAGLIAFNISLGQIEAKIGFRADQGTGARKFTYLPVQSSQKVREARISRSPDQGSLVSTPDTFRLSGGYLEGKEVRTLHLTVQSSLTFSDRKSVV